MAFTPPNAVCTVTQDGVLVDQVTVAVAVPTGLTRTKHPVVATLIGVTLNTSTTPTIVGLNCAGPESLAFSVDSAVLRATLTGSVMTQP